MKFCDSGMEIWIRVLDNEFFCEFIWYNIEGRNDSIFIKKNIFIVYVLGIKCKSYFYLLEKEVIRREEDKRGGRVYGYGNR